MKIVDNEQYKIETVELNGGTKNVLVMYEDIEQLDITMKYIKDAAPIVEQLFGITYPKETITYKLSNVTKKAYLNLLVLWKFLLLEIFSQYFPSIPVSF